MLSSNRVTAGGSPSISLASMYVTHLLTTLASLEYGRRPQRSTMLGTEDAMADAKPMQIANLNEAPAIFADVFLVSGDPEAANYSIYFCQKQVQIPSVTADKSVEVPSSGTAQCVARIVFTEKGLDSLLEGLQQNKEFTAALKRRQAKEREAKK